MKKLKLKVDLSEIKLKDFVYKSLKHVNSEYSTTKRNHTCEKNYQITVPLWHYK